MEFDELSLIRNNKPFKLGLAEIKQKTLGEIDDIGYEKYQNYLFTIITESLDIADILWFENKIWYEDIKNEWNFFIEKATYKKESLKVFVGNKEFNATKIDDGYRDSLNFFLGIEGEYIVIDKKIEENNYETILYNIQKNNNGLYEFNLDCFKFTQHFYELLKNFLKEINFVKIHHDFLDGGNKRTKIYILKQKYKDRKKNKKENVTIGSIVSSLIAKGVIYEDIWNYPIYLVYNQYYRYIRFDDWNNTMKALYSGCLNTEKNPINFEKINWSSVLN